ncbi:MAG TPA: hypothetical protein VFA15_01120, partial [Nitrososphaera sp.]|nr:hypothetical protein [Nitrososphaera sp.]
MSEKAFRIYDDALKQQHSKNEARRIRTRVSEARRNPHPAALRWPFELLQNALDVGPRKDRSSVTIRLRHDPTRVVFEHDGTPFTSVELAALLSGGSSKEFESEVTTGRFGTGFLVTHVLAEQTNLRGLLEVESGFEQFDLTLDREGDEDRILQNIYSCNDAIRKAEPVHDIDGLPSALFEYPITDNGMLVTGLAALKQALPYLYATRESLGLVEFQTGDHDREVWTASSPIQEPFDNGHVEYRSIHVEHNGIGQPEIRVFRFSIGHNSAALVLVEQLDGRWHVRLPEPDAPRIYREYPLRGSGFLPLSFVLDGKFEPDQERSVLLMGEEDRKLLQEALTAAVLAIEYALREEWGGMHLLSRVFKPATAFDPTNPEERQWWVAQLATFAKQVADLPIVNCISGFLPATISDKYYADFVIPRLLLSSTEKETTVERLWPLVATASNLTPPQRELALDWTEIAEGWVSLGLELNLYSVSDLAAHVGDEAKTLDELFVDINPKEWLAQFLDVVGECWSNRKGIDLSVIEGLLPNQNERLCSPKELRRDSGIPDQLKDICAEMGYDVRGQLLLDGFNEIAKAAGLKYLLKAVEDAIQATLLENEVITEAVRQLNAIFPEGKDCDDKTSRQQNASVRLLHYLWETQGGDAAALIGQIPLITLKQRAVRWSRDRMMMAPVCSW